MGCNQWEGTIQGFFSVLVYVYVCMRSNQFRKEMPLYRFFVSYLCRSRALGEKQQFPLHSMKDHNKDQVALTMYGMAHRLQAVHAMKLLFVGYF